MTKHKKTQISSAEFYRDFLQGEGVKAHIDDNGYVIFKYEFTNYIIQIDPKDENFFQLTYQFLYDIESQEEYHRAIKACVNITRSTKVVKISALGDSGSAFQASAEAFIDSPEAATKLFQRYLGVIKIAVSEFAEQMKES